MKRYHGKAHQMERTHTWVEEQLQALGYSTDGLMVLNLKKTLHAVMLDGRRLFAYDYSREVIILNDGARYNCYTGQLIYDRGRDSVEAELADIIETAVRKQVEQDQ